MLFTQRQSQHNIYTTHNYYNIRLFRFNVFLFPIPINQYSTDHSNCAKFEQHTFIFFFPHNMQHSIELPLFFFFRAAQQHSALVILHTHRHRVRIHSKSVVENTLELNMYMFGLKFRMNIPRLKWIAHERAPIVLFVAAGHNGNRTLLNQPVNWKTLFCVCYCLVAGRTSCCVSTVQVNVYTFPVAHSNSANSSSQRSDNPVLIDYKI